MEGGKRWSEGKLYNPSELDGKLVGQSTQERGGGGLSILIIYMYHEHAVLTKRGLLSLHSSHDGARIYSRKSYHLNFLDYTSRFYCQELISVMISPPITPNKFWGFNKCNSQEELRNFPEISEDFLCFVSLEIETTENAGKLRSGSAPKNALENGEHEKFTKNPAIFQCQIPRQTQRENSQKFSGERAK